MKLLPIITTLLCVGAIKTFAEPIHIWSDGRWMPTEEPAQRILDREQNQRIYSESVDGFDVWAGVQGVDNGARWQVGFVLKDWIAARGELQDHWLAFRYVDPNAAAMWGMVANNDPAILEGDFEGFKRTVIVDAEPETKGVVQASVDAVKANPWKTTFGTLGALYASWAISEERIDPWTKDSPPPAEKVEPRELEFGPLLSNTQLPIGSEVSFERTEDSETGTLRIGPEHEEESEESE
ncbi:hypothetical protein N9204_00350 [bacterium]|nr:hypothetical protein [bacterium]